MNSYSKSPPSEKYDANFGRNVDFNEFCFSPPKKSILIIVSLGPASEAGKLIYFLLCMFFVLYATENQHEEITIAHELTH